ncbi:MAG: transcription termination/antitermination protein NusG [Terracidiphilus sp.]
MLELPKKIDWTAPVRPATALQWFAAYTASHHEKQVLNQLTLRNVESYLPVYKASRQWQKRASVTLDLPLFPNYVFVRISRNQRAAVLGTPGVFSIVGSASNAWELPEREIEALRNGLHERKVEPHPYLVIGERARVKTGMLAGLEGVIVRRKTNLNIVLTLDQIMQSVAIEVDAAELEPVPDKSKPVVANWLQMSRDRDGLRAVQDPNRLMPPWRNPASLSS